MMKPVISIAAGLAFGAAAAPALALQPDAAVRQQIIRESIAAYPGPGACPYTLLRNGQPAGERSAYNRPGERTVKCYPADISAAEIAAWRRARRQGGGRP
jgi:hypothetical protein